MSRVRAVGRLEGRAVLLAGHRFEAIRAARALGLRPLVLAARRLRKEPDYPYEVLGKTLEETTEAIQRLEAHGPIEGVLALTEVGVEAACLARRILDLPGPRDAAPLTHKAAMKERIRAAGIPCASWMILEAESDPAEVAETLGLPLVIKRPTGGGGKNLVIARDVATVASAIRPGWVAESFVRGLELSVETIQAGGKVQFRNFTRYVEPRWVNLVPSTLRLGIRRAVGALADRALEALDLHEGITHLEVFLGEDGPVFGEIAARPPGGRIMDLIELAYDFQPWEALAQVAMGRRPRLPRRPLCFAAACFLHPGPGTVRAIHGLPEARYLDGVIRASARVSVGDVLTDRVGVAERAAEVIAVGDDAETCLHHLGNARRQIRFEMDR